MKPFTPPSRVLLCWLCWVAVALVGPGCRRAVKPDLGPDRTVEAGMPVRFGAEGPDAPVVTWRFGDKAEPRKAAQATHAWARAGTYTVEALDEDGKVVGSARLTVVPRPLLRAIPAEADFAAFFPELRGKVRPVLDFYARVMGRPQAVEALREAPLLGLVVGELGEGEGPGLVDVDEGLGVFSLPDFEGNVALLGVTEPQAALDAAVRQLEESGARVMQLQPTGLVYLERLQEGPMGAFVDRGYLYLVVPDSPEEGDVTHEGGTVDRQGSLETIEKVRAQIAALSGPGLSELPLVGELRAKADPGLAYLFARPTGEDAASGFRGLWGALQVGQDGLSMEVSGLIATERPLFEGKQGPPSTLLEKAPAGAVAALQVSVPPEELAKLVFGDPGSERRERNLLRLAEQGFAPADAEALLGALRGDVSALLYFDAAAFYRNFIRGTRRPEPRGTVLLEAGLLRSQPVLEWLTQRMADREQPFETVKQGTTTLLRTRFMDQPVDVSVSPEQVVLRGGEALPERPRESLAQALQGRFGGQAFSSGHLSLMVDVNRLRSDLEAVQEVPGVPAMQLPVAKALVGTLLDQLPPVDMVFFDFAPAEGGGRFRLRTSIRVP
jgi:hypothetical protein